MCRCNLPPLHTTAVTQGVEQLLNKIGTESLILQLFLPGMVPATFHHMSSVLSTELSQKAYGYKRDHRGSLPLLHGQGLAWGAEQTW